MEKPKSYPKNFKPITDGYKVRICMEHILEFMKDKDDTIKSYGLFDFREYLQKQIEQEGHDI